MIKKIDDYKRWDDVYKKYKPSELPWFSRTAHKDFICAIQRLPLKQGRALDIGCGLGQTSMYLANAGFVTDAIDVSETAIKFCKSVWKMPNLSFRCQNSLTYKPETSYDLVVDFLHIHDIQIHHFEIYTHLLKELVCDEGFLVLCGISTEDHHCVSGFNRNSYYVDGSVVHHPIENITKSLEGKLVLISNESIVVGSSQEAYIAYLLVFKGV